LSHHDTQDSERTGISVQPRTRPIACFIIDLPDLGGAEKIRKLGVPVPTQVSFEGH
jgi:hypothetical protein